MLFALHGNSIGNCFVNCDYLITNIVFCHKLVNVINGSDTVECTV